MFTLRDKLSALLMDSAENKHYRVHIPLELNENQGLSTNDMLIVEEIWQHETEGIIMLKFIGIGEPKELEDFEECIPQIYNYMNDYMAEKTKYLLTERETYAPDYEDYVFQEVFNSYEEASERMRDIYHSTIIEGNPDAIEKTEFSTNSIYVLLNDGNGLYWEITKK